MKTQKRHKLVKEIIIRHIKNNIKDYTILLLIFIIGLIIGVMFINYTADEQKQEISVYVTNFINEMKENSTIDKAGLLRDVLIRNIGLSLCMWIIGMAVTLVPVLYGLVLFRGFSLGYTISAIIGVLGIGKGLLFNISALLLQNILIIPATLALGVSGIRLYKSIIKDRKKENIKMEILRSYYIFCINSWNACNCVFYRDIYI